MNVRISFLCFLFLIGLNISSYSQGQGKSPYSTFGLGEMTDDSFGPQDMMGGAGVSFANTFYLNEMNPALLSKARVINGVKYVGLGVGVKGNFKTLQQDSRINQDFGLNLSRLSIAFPVVSKWTVGFNFRPYTIVDSEVEKNMHFEGSSSVATYHFKDEGGISKVGFVNSIQPLKGLFVGLEGQYFFGNINRDTLTNFLGSNDYIKYGARHALNGFSAKGGVAYQQKIFKDWALNVGGTYQLGNTLKGENINIFQTLASDGIEVPAIYGPTDTLSIGNRLADLPSKYKVGVSLEKVYNWVFAVDYGMTNWEGIQNHYNPTSKDILKNSTELGVGIEWIPNAGSHSYFNQVFYRAGFKSVNTPYVINNIRVKDNSFTLGFSLPLGMGTDYLDLGLAVGQRGTLSNGLVKENYIKISASFSLVRDWFHRPTIN